MEIEDIITRLKTNVADFYERIEGAAEWTAVVKAGRVPNQTPAAYVLPLGLTATPADTAAGMHRQSYTEVYGVVIVLTVANDLKGSKALPQIHSLRDAVIQALTGWQPAGAWDVLSLSRAQLKSMSAGTITYQVDFKTAKNLRIPL